MHSSSLVAADFAALYLQNMLYGAGLCPALEEKTYSAHMLNLECLAF